MVGVLKPSDDGPDEVLDKPCFTPATERTLHHIISIFSEAEVLVSRYGVRQAKPVGDDPQEAIMGANQLSKYKTSYQQFLARVNTI